MALAAGQSLTFYEILGPLGAGGMGEVYRARDTRLDREVAIKVLPEEFANDDERLRRFEREAKTLASLNHTNVAGIYGVDRVGDTCFLALELVPGEDLAERIARGPLPEDESIEICRQIAEGLEVAHEAGVIHRDLKPANVRITPDGVAKVLDFGLAKPIRPQTTSEGTSSAQSDSFLVTEEGLVLGTPTYMSPEQARGKPVDKRTDIWAFGCVLFECLTGKRAFEGEGFGDLIVAILEHDVDLGGLPAATPPRVRRLITRALAKDPRRRLRDIGEARILLTEAEPKPQDTAAPAGPRARRMAGMAAVATLAAVSLLAREITRTEAERSSPQTRFVLGETIVNAGSWYGNLVTVSADGGTIAYIGVSGDTRVFVRKLDEFEPTPVVGSERGRSPFLSPDGEWVGYWAEGFLQKAPTRGGEPSKLAELPAISSGIWTTEDRIVISETVGSLLVVDAITGDSRRLTQAANSSYHGSPNTFPGDRIVFTTENSSIAVASLGSGDWQLLDLIGDNPHWSPSGHVVYTDRSSKLWACAVDPDALDRTGEPFRLLDNGVLDFDLAANGTLVFVPGASIPVGELVWVDRMGQAQPVGLEPECFVIPRLSPDGSRVAVSIQQPGGDLTKIWLYEIGRGSRVRLPDSGPINLWPVWTHGGTEIHFMNSGAIWRVPATGDGEPQPMHANPEFDVSTSWNEELQALAYYDYGQASDLKLFHGDGQIETFLATEYDERSPHLSPNGRWIAYVSNQSGRDEVYVRSYERGEAAGAPVLVSAGGGSAPAWSPDGLEVFYRRGTRMFGVKFDAGPPSTAATPQLLFDGPYRTSPVGRGNPNYDVGPDGRFLMVRAIDDQVPQRIHVARNWSVIEEIERDD